MKKAKPGIYAALGSKGYELCQPVDKEDYERIDTEITGTLHRAGWKPIPVRLVHDDEGKTLAKSDSPWLGYGPLIFRASVVDALGPMLRAYGELLPLACSETELVVFNPTRVLNALDEAASTIMRFDDGRIMLIQKHAFRGDVVGKNDIFTIPNERAAPTFLSHRFVDRWNASGLTGLEFKRLWSPPN